MIDFITVDGNKLPVAFFTAEQLLRLMGMGSLPLEEGQALLQMKEQGLPPFDKAPVTSAAPVPPVAPVVAPVASDNNDEYAQYKASFDGDAARQRIAEETEYLKGMGLSPAQPYYDPSVGLVSWGVTNFNQQLANFDAMPDFADVAREAADRITSEQRLDIDVETGKLRLLQDSDGLILSRGAGQLRLTEHALRKLAGYHLTAGARIGPDWRFMRSMSADEIEELLNSRFARLESRGLRLRTRRNPNGAREVYAVTSQTYSAFDADRVLRLVAEAAPDAYRGRVLYDPNTTSCRFEGWVHARDVSTIGPGSAFKAGFSGRTGDDGGTGFNLYREIVRNLCRNLIILDEIKDNTLSVRHRGTVAEKVFTEARQSMASITKDWEWFADRWGYGKASLAEAFPETNKLLDGEPQAHEVLTLIAEGKIKVGGAALGATLGIERDAMVEALLGGWAQEPGEDLEAIVNAVTRLHERVPVEVLPALAQAGGQLLTERTALLN